VDSLRRLAPLAFLLPRQADVMLLPACCCAEWAALELAGGNQFKALSVVSKGLKEAAQPARWVLPAGAG